MKTSFLFFIALGCMSVQALLPALFAGAPYERDRAIEKKIRDSFRDPLIFPCMELNPQGVIRVKQNICYMTSYGLKNAAITKLESNITAGYVKLSYEATNLTSYLKYKLDGKCLLLPIWGEGVAIVVIKDVKVSFLASVYVKKNKEIVLRGLDLTFDFNGGSFDMSSLFGETKVKALTQLYVATFNKYFNSVLKDILCPYMDIAKKLLALALIANFKLN